MHKRKYDINHAALREPSRFRVRRVTHGVYERLRRTGIMGYLFPVSAVRSTARVAMRAMARDKKGA